MAQRLSIRRVVFGFAAPALLLLALPLRASDQAASPQQIATLVRDLGAPNFASREKASRELLKLGIVTDEALERATQSPDAEVRTRPGLS